MLMTYDNPSMATNVSTSTISAAISRQGMYHCLKKVSPKDFFFAVLTVVELSARFDLVIVSKMNMMIFLALLPLLGKQNRFGVS